MTMEARAYGDDLPRELMINDETGLVVEYRGRIWTGRNYDSGKSVCVCVRPGSTTFQPGEWCPVSPWGKPRRKAEPEDLAEEML